MMFILSMCFVSASQTNSNSAEMILQTEDGLQVQSNDLNHTPKNFSDIQNTINDAEEDEIIIINGTYKANSTDNTITVDKKLTFQGINNATVDGSSQIQLFQIKADGVIFKNIIFKNAKTDSDGGAVNGKNVNFINCTFINNSANFGGAVYGGGCNVVDSNFINNSAYYVGALYSLNSQVFNSTFIGNIAITGVGAMCLGTAQNSRFINNSAKNAGACQNVYVLNCMFINNNATDGGAMQGGFCANSLFINNTATANGGALDGVSAVKCEFINNSAQSGGAMNYGNVEQSYFFNNHADNGGAIYRASSLNCTFIGNTAYSGGAIRESASSKSVFINNSATNGGAIWGGDATDCQFISNHGTRGGAIRSASAYNCIFIANTAAGGGAICLENNNDEALNCIFINNSASEGGAMYWGESRECVFINNSASKGGAKYFGISVKCNFTNNSATEGGALYMGTIEESVFINNSATYGGAVYGRHNYAYYPPNYGHASIKNSLFINNSASKDGGAVNFADISDSIFINNSAPNGGAVNSASCENCSFTNNNANYGGAILIDDKYRSWTVKNSNFTSNNVHDGEGYAVYLKSNSEILECDFKDCTSNSIAVYDNFKDYNVLNCKFDVNPQNINFTYDTELKVNNLTIYYGEGGILKANLTSTQGPLFDKVISFNVNGIVYNRTTNLNGQAFFNIADYIAKSGVYTVTLSFEGDNHYKAYKVNSTVNINKYSTCLMANNLSLIQNEFGLLIVNLSHNYDALANKRITLTVNGNRINKTTNSQGLVYVNVKEYFNDLGKYNININFEGDELYESSQINTTVTINKYKAVMTFQKNGKYYSDTYLTFRLTDSNTNNPISNTLIKVLFSNGQTKDTITDSNGQAVCNIELNPGCYNITAKVWDENIEVNTVEIRDLDILKITGQINLKQEENNHRNLKITVTDLDGEKYRNIKVVLEFDNGKYAEIITDENGFADYKMNFNPGKYSVLAHVSSDFNEIPTEVYDIVIKEKTDSKISFTNNITFEYQKIGYSNISVEGGGISPGDVYVIGHPEAVISLSDNILAIYGLDVGNYTLFTRTTPDEYHNSANTTLNVNVNYAEAEITFSGGLKFEYGASDSNYVAVTGGIVEKHNIKVLNHPEAVIKFENNKITVSGLHPGDYILYAESTPDENHKKANSTARITVKKAKVIIKASKITVALKKSSYLKIRVVDPKNNRPISNIRLDLKVFTGKKYKTYHVSTNSKGIASFKTSRLSKGNHKVIISGVNTNFDVAAVTSSVKVIKQKKLTFKAKVINGKDGSTISITVKKSKKAVNGVRIKLIIFTGKKYIIKILKTKKKGKYNGVVGYGTNKLAVGKHKIIIKPVSIKYSGSLKSKMLIKKSAKKSNPWETVISAK